MPIGGLVEPGNINLYNRPITRNPDGSVSTVRSIGIEDKGKQVVIPTVHDDGHIMSDEEAISNYKKTGRHLGKFNSITAANAYAQQLHRNTAAGMYGQQYTGSRSSIQSLFPAKNTGGSIPMGLPVQLPPIPGSNLSTDTIFGRRGK